MWAKTNKISPLACVNSRNHGAKPEFLAAGYKNQSTITVFFCLKKFFKLFINFSKFSKLKRWMINNLQNWKISKDKISNEPSKISFLTKVCKNSHAFLRNAKWNYQFLSFNFYSQNETFAETFGSWVPI